MLLSSAAGETSKCQDEDARQSTYCRLHTFDFVHCTEAAVAAVVNAMAC